MHRYCRFYRAIRVGGGWFLLLTALKLMSACASIKPYEKEYLLHPAMDDSKVARLNSFLMPAAAADFEKLSLLGAGGGAATSCPTCGG